MKLKTEQINKYKRYAEIIGVSIMAIYVSFGIYAYLVTDESCQFSVFCLALNEVFADKSTEGNTYFVSITDSVGSSEDKSTEGNNYFVSISDSIESSEILR